MRLSAPTPLALIRFGVAAVAVFVFGWVMPEFNPLYAQEEGGGGRTSSST